MDICRNWLKRYSNTSTENCYLGAIFVKLHQRLRQKKYNHITVSIDLDGGYNLLLSDKTLQTPKEKEKKNLYLPPMLNTHSPENGREEKSNINNERTGHEEHC